MGVVLDLLLARRSGAEQAPSGAVGDAGGSAAESGAGGSAAAAIAVPALTPPVHARPMRSLAKTVTWRVVASADTFALGLIVTGSVMWAGSIASLEVLTKMFLYYLHERAWAYVGWGVE